MKTAILTPFECGSFTKLFSKDRANKYFEKGMVVFFAGGTGHPYFSTDTGVVLRAVEVDADVILLAKSIDGVYDADPNKDPNAKKVPMASVPFFPGASQLNQSRDSARLPGAGFAPL